MKNKKQIYKLPIIFSIILHAIIFALLFLHFSPKKIDTPQNVKIVQAVVINQSQLQADQPSQPQAPKPEQLVSKVEALPENTIRRIEQVALKQPEVRKIPITKTLSNKTPTESLPEKIAEVSKEENVALQEPNIDEKAALKKQEEEKKREEKKRKDEIKKKEAELAKKQREEETQQLQKELAEESKPTNPPAASKADNEEEAESPAEGLEEKLQAETKQLSGAKQAAAGEADKYKQMIIQTISRRWLIPETDNKDLACQLLVHVAPGGVVLSVDILKESGDPNLDRSARNAIMKASPLPVPEDSDLFDNFRALRLTFRPQGIISG